MDQNLPDPSDSSRFFKAMRIMRIAMLIGCLVFLGILVLITEFLNKNPSRFDHFGDISVILCVSIGIILFFVRKARFAKKMQLVNEEPDFSKKLNLFREAIIISFALIEGPALFSGIMYFVTGNQWLIGVCLIILAQFDTVRLSQDVI